MKKLSKLILSLLAVVIITAVIEAPSHAYTNSSYNITMIQTYAATNGCTVQWNAPSMDSEYQIRGYYLTLDYYYDKSEPEKYPLVGKYGSSATQAWINLSPNYTGKVYLTCYYKHTTSSGSVKNGYKHLTSAAINTVPSELTSNFCIDSVYSDNTLTFKVDRPNLNYKSQVWLFQNYSSVGIITFNARSDDVYCASDIAYRYCARCYYTNPDNKVTYAGNWSSFRAFDIPYFKCTAKSSKKGFTMKIKKATAVAYYNLYVNDRFVKRLSTSKKSKSISIKKGYLKKNYNRIKLVPVISGYGESDLNKTKTLYIYK